jgi:hypothetical protein
VIRALVLLAPAAAAAGLSAATPLSPAPNARVATPVFRWDLPAGEESESIAIADEPATDPTGAFPATSVVDGAPLAPARREWVPTITLVAGRYWWSVASKNLIGVTEHSPPSPFTVPVSLRIVAVRMATFPRPARLRLEARWKGNVRNASARLSLIHRGKLVWTRTRRVSASPGAVAPVVETIRLPRGVPRRARLTLRATVRYGNVGATRQRVFRGP